MALLTILQRVNSSEGSQLLAKETTGWDSRLGDQFAKQAMLLCFTLLYSKVLLQVRSIREDNMVEGKAVEQEKEKLLGVRKLKQAKFQFGDSGVAFTMIYVHLYLLQCKEPPEMQTIIICRSLTLG